MSDVRVGISIEMSSEKDAEGKPTPFTVEEKEDIFDDLERIRQHRLRLSGPPQIYLTEEELKRLEDARAEMKRYEERGTREDLILSLLLENKKQIATILEEVKALREEMTSAPIAHAETIDD